MRAVFFGFLVFCACCSCWSETGGSSPTELEPEIVSPPLPQPLPTLSTTLEKFRQALTQLSTKTESLHEDLLRAKASLSKSESMFESLEVELTAALMVSAKLRDSLFSSGVSLKTLRESLRLANSAIGLAKASLRTERRRWILLTIATAGGGVLVGWGLS